MQVVFRVGIWRGIIVAIIKSISRNPKSRKFISGDTMFFHEVSSDIESNIFCTQSL